MGQKDKGGIGEGGQAVGGHQLPRGGLSVAAGLHPRPQSKDCTRPPENFADFWPSNMWPPSNPDCNPVDCAIWGMSKRKTCRTPHCNVAGLKVAMETEWVALTPEFIKKPCASFHPCLHGGCPRWTFSNVVEY